MDLYKKFSHLNLPFHFLMSLPLPLNPSSQQDGEEILTVAVE